MKEPMTITIPISQTQIELLKYLEEGLTQKEICDKMDLAPTKLKRILYLMCEQWQCKNAVQLIGYAIRNGVI